MKLLNSTFSSRGFILLAFGVLQLLILSAQVADAYTQVCRCSCASNYTVFELPDDGLSYSQTCTNCTKKFCLSKNLDICNGVDELLVQATCFQRESLKEQFFIYLFIIVTSCLLIYAALAPYALAKFQVSDFDSTIIRFLLTNVYFLQASRNT